MNDAVKDSTIREVFDLFSPEPIRTTRPDVKTPIKIPTDSAIIRMMENIQQTQHPRSGTPE